MRERYQTSIVMGAVEGHDPTGLRGTVPQGAHFLDMGDGTCILMSAEEYARRITPNEILAQEAQEVAAQPNVLPPPPWKFFGAPVVISGLDLLNDRLAQPSEESVQSIDNAMKRIAPWDPRRTAEGFPADRERERGIKAIGTRHGWHCATCYMQGDTSSEAESRLLFLQHAATPAHERAEEKRLRANLEYARTALYDYLKSKGRVA